MRLGVSRTFVCFCALAGLLTFGVSSASAVDAFHGIGFFKSCESTTNVGQPLRCAYQILNAPDTAHDDLKITALVDQVHAASGDQSSGNILGALELIFIGNVSCVGGSGSGTEQDPYIGATACTLPYSTLVLTHPHSFYAVQPGDGALPGRHLRDTATLTWWDLCTGSSTNCPRLPITADADAMTTIAGLASSTATEIRNAAGQPVTTVEPGTSVHDFVTVTGQPGQPMPSGSVSVVSSTNGTCTVDLSSHSSRVTLDAAGHADATGFTVTPAVGRFSFFAVYDGDATFFASQSPCEPLTVVDANMQVTPQSAQNPIKTTQTLTGHVNVNAGDGAGYVGAPDGTVIAFSLAGPGSIVGASSCTTTGGTGSCQVEITSAALGATIVHATTTVHVGGLLLVRVAEARLDWQGRGGLITRKHDDCDDYLNGTAQPLARVTYSVRKNGEIGGRIAPSSFTFYAQIGTTTPNQRVSVDQSSTSANAAAFEIKRARLWNADCTRHVSGADDRSGSFTISIPGTYTLAIDYGTKSLAGTIAPPAADVTYAFTTSLGGNTGASLLLTKE